MGLRRPVSAQEHEAILKNLLSDADRLIGLTNSLLFLAKILEQVSQFPVANFHMEDVLFTAREELRWSNKSAQ